MGIANFIMWMANKANVSSINKFTVIFLSYKKIRNFCKKNNSNVHYIEIDQATYKSLSSKTRKYDYGLYTPGKIDWVLEGNVVKINRRLS